MRVAQTGIENKIQRQCRKFQERGHQDKYTDFLQLFVVDLGTHGQMRDVRLLAMYESSRKSSFDWQVRVCLPNKIM